MPRLSVNIADNLEIFKRFGKFRVAEPDLHREVRAANSVPDAPAVSSEHEDALEFSHHQLHCVIDMAIEQAAERSGLKTDHFAHVAVELKKAFPESGTNNEPTFSRTQVRKVIDLVAERCMKCISERS